MFCRPWYISDKSEWFSSISYPNQAPYLNVFVLFSIYHLYSTVFLHEEEGRALTFVVSADIEANKLLRSHDLALKLEINLQATSK